jgi:hypothetical protein
MITDRIYLESVLKIAILAVCLSFRLVRSPQRLAEARIFPMASQKDSRRASLAGMTAFGFFHAFINNDYLV